MAEITPVKEKIMGKNPIVIVVVALLLIFAIWVGSAALSTFLSGSDNDSEVSTSDQKGAATKQKTAEVVATIECQPDEKLWKATGGWCTSPALAPGQYRIKLQRWNTKMAIWNQDSTKIVDSMVIPEEGMALTRWKGQPYEQQFQDEALLGSHKRVMAPIYRIDGEKAKPLTEGTFTLSEQGVVKIGVNVIAAVDAFRGNTGGMTVVIEKL